jgi:hypothetical protein
MEWITVNIPYQDNWRLSREKFKKIDKWLCDNIERRADEHSWIYDSKSNYREYLFLDKNDAVLFKLTWG